MNQIGCLKLLPPEELEQLDIPMDKESGIPIKKVVYMTETEKPVEEGNFNLSRQHFVGTRFNLFTGNQTLEQRERSFKVISCILHILSLSLRQDISFHLLQKALSTPLPVCSHI